MMNNAYKNFTSKQELANAFAIEVETILSKSIKLNNKATLLLSGGNTPKLFLNTLSTKKLDWEKVTIGLVDERCVETSNKDSNEYLIKNELCINDAKKANFIGMFKSSSLKLEEQVKECSTVYRNFFQNADVLVLGMGNDGHTASLFPFNEKLELAYNLENPTFCISIKPDTAPYERISLTLDSILKAKNIFLHIEGKEKIEVYNEVIKSDDTLKYPILKVFNSTNSIKVYAHE